jgi:CheY-like chemotaxis protein
LDPSAGRPRPTQAGKRILIVEDDDLTREMLTTILQGEGYLTETAADGCAALAHLRMGALPDLILLDLLMPIMNGWEFRAAQEQEVRLASIPVVIVSATDRDLAEAASSLHAAAHLRKPITIEDLLDVVSRC